MIDNCVIDSNDCKMTTIAMLERCECDYKSARANILKQLDDISERYYKNIDIPPEVLKKITSLNQDVLKVENIISDIESAIRVIETEI